LLRFFVLGVQLLSSARAEEAPGFHLHDGDTVVFFGDSITNQRLYTVFTETYVLTRFPRMRVAFVHSGWSGDRVTGGFGGPIDLRLDRDVFAYGATVITIMLGMNDAEYHPYEDSVFNIFANGYRHILDRIKATALQARVTLLEPSPYDDVTRPPEFTGGYNAVLLKYGEAVPRTCPRKEPYGRGSECARSSVAQGGDRGFAKASGEIDPGPRSSVTGRSSSNGGSAPSRVGGAFDCLSGRDRQRHWNSDEDAEYDHRFHRSSGPGTLDELGRAIHAGVDPDRRGAANAA
jgi:lysophospholipase L1-like esterase